jgi:hypothetical protein
MSVADIILVTVATTVAGTVVVLAVIKWMIRVWKFLHGFVEDVRNLTSAANAAVGVMVDVRNELAYQRQLVTAANPQLAEQMQQGTPPPIGQASVIPGEFPKRPWESYPPAPVPDATKEDTDMSLIEQNDEDLMVAQDREEKIAKGIEPDDDYGPRPAVREEA